MSAEVERALVALWKQKEADGWRSAPLKFAVRFSGGGTPDRTNPDYWNGKIPWVSPKDMKAKTISGAAECITEEGLNSSTSALVQPGTVLVVARSGILKHSIPVGIAKVPVAINQDLKAMVFNETADPEYYAYFIDGHVSQLLTLWRKQGATVESLDHESVANTVVPVPPLPEQRAIAGFLDRETAKIDALVEEQRRLIALLKEKRQAVISHAVTKGLDPAAPMKPSGIDWLGDIPAHWEVRSLKRVSPSITVGIVVNPSSYVADEGLPFIYGGEISPFVVDHGRARRISAENSASQPKTQLRAGDIVTVRVGDPGVSAVVPPECEGGNCASVMLIRKGEHSSDWIAAVMNSDLMRYQIKVVEYGAAQRQFNISHAVDFVMPVPPIEETKRIAEHLEFERSRIDSLVTEAGRAITLLQERRSALISAAVTGKIDVRDEMTNSTEAA